jgi:hypothetical protein
LSQIIKDGELKLAMERQSGEERLRNDVEQSRAARQKANPEVYAYNQSMGLDP